MQQLVHSPYDVLHGFDVAVIDFRGDPASVADVLESTADSVPIDFFSFAQRIVESLGFGVLLDLNFEDS